MTDDDFGPHKVEWYTWHPSRVDMHNGLHIAHGHCEIGIYGPRMTSWQCRRVSVWTIEGHHYCKQHAKIVRVRLAEARKRLMK